LTDAPTCAEVRGELGVYLLGAIAASDRSTLESHLAFCADCRRQLADLAGLPGLLRRVPLNEVAQVPSEDADGKSATADHRLGSLLIQAAKRRRRRMRWYLTALTVAGLAAGATAAFAVRGTPGHRPAAMALPGALTVRGSNPSDHTSAVVTYVGRPWGVQLEVQVKGVAAGTNCVLDVTDSNGQQSEAASWTVAADDKTAWYAASSSVPVTAVRGFVVTTGSQTLIRVGVSVPSTRIRGGRLSPN
jgi:predicted anti-sigma-YlaC factor YlaD